MNKFSELFKEADNSFNQNYGEELKLLKALTENEISKIRPNTNEKEVYESLIKIVDEAINKNLSQAEIISKIRNLGTTAIKIAKKIPGFNNVL